MKSFKITMKAPAFQIWEYQVDADSEEEAVDRALRGDIEPLTSYVEYVDEEHMELEVREAHL